MHYYKRNLGDYAKKAGRLSMLQHGSYTLLIDACYDREQFPTLDDAIEWTWASTKEEIEAVEFVLRKFFVLENGVYVQKRIQEELAEYRAKAETNKRIAEERETRRKEKLTNRTQVVDEPPPNHKPITTNHKPIKAEAHGNDPMEFNGSAPLPAQIEPELPKTPAVTLTVELRKLGVSVTSMHPTLLDWVSKGVSVDMAKEAVAIARQRKPSGSISPNYLTPILAEMLNPPAVKGAAPVQLEAKRWWESASGIQAKGKELGLVESEKIFAHYRDRVFAAAGDGPWRDKSGGAMATQGLRQISQLVAG